MSPNGRRNPVNLVLEPLCCLLNTDISLQSVLNDVILWLVYFPSRNFWNNLLSEIICFYALFSTITTNGLWSRVLRSTFVLVLLALLHSCNSTVNVISHLLEKCSRSYPISSSLLLKMCYIFPHTSEVVQKHHLLF